MAYIRTKVHYYVWEGGGHEEERYFIIKDFINRGGGEGSKPLMNSSLNIPFFFLKSSLINNLINYSLRARMSNICSSEQKLKESSFELTSKSSSSWLKAV